MPFAVWDIESANVSQYFNDTLYATWLCPTGRNWVPPVTFGSGFFVNTPNNSGYAYGTSAEFTIQERKLTAKVGLSQPLTTGNYVIYVSPFGTITDASGNTAAEVGGYPFTV